eukprot:TRINITY_DN3367_c0_g1_i2.p2 TRINITY_DN3367_c0_g1~~TRINITY_DN3367_c0_g1_i2.p2  ORF type:complete len:159 (+),score=31.78 TRINITY_DN3367_c0_g1_i2:708-1184(+)
MPTAGAPSPRGGSTLVGLGHRIYVFFGFDGKEHGDVTVYDVIKHEWSPLRAGGSPPAPRSVSGAVVLGKDEIFSWGGEVSPADPKLGHSGAGTFSNEGYLLDVSSGLWDKLISRGEKPSARGWHAFTRIKNGMALHGGYGGDGRLNDLYLWTLDLDRS